MRDTQTGASVRANDGNDTSPFPIRFTGNAIQHLSANMAPFNLKEWQWHEEEINGQRLCIITDRFLSAGDLM